MYDSLNMCSRRMAARGSRLTFGFAAQRQVGRDRHDFGALAARAERVRLADTALSLVESGSSDATSPSPRNNFASFDHTAARPPALQPVGGLAFGALHSSGLASGCHVTSRSRIRPHPAAVAVVDAVDLVGPAGRRQSCRRRAHHACTRHHRRYLAARLSPGRHARSGRTSLLTGNSCRPAHRRAAHLPRHVCGHRGTPAATSWWRASSSRKPSQGDRHAERAAGRRPPPAACEVYVLYDAVGSHDHR